MKGHEEDDECEGREAHHGDCHVAIFHKIDVFAAHAYGGAINER